MGLRTVYLENIWKSLAQSLYVPKGLMNAIIALTEYRNLGGGKWWFQWFLIRYHRDTVLTSTYWRRALTAWRKLGQGQLSSDRSEEQFNWEHKKLKVKVAHSCPTLCNPMDYTVHGILQTRILEWVAYPFSRGPSWPRNQTGVSCIAGRFFTNWTMKEAKRT